MGYFVSLCHKQDGGKDSTLGFVKRIRNDVQYFKQNDVPTLFTTVNKSASGIKEIILDVRFPKQKNQRVIFQCEDRAGMTSKRIVLQTATLDPHSCLKNFPKWLFERDSSCSRHARVISL
ncbi:hypothetical protein TNCV_371211 [Trichonephila clavipes]|nr:hypothetical protein TNCV_371211 [Trichonephila clavipes]